MNTEQILKNPVIREKLSNTEQVTALLDPIAVKLDINMSKTVGELIFESKNTFNGPVMTK